MTRLTLVAALKHISQDLERLAVEIQENTATSERQIEFAETLADLAATIAHHARAAEHTVIEVDLESVQLRGRTQPGV